MAQAAYCSMCGTNVWVASDGRCQNGHDASCLSGHYLTQDPPAVPAETQALQAVGAYAAPAAAPAPVPAVTSYEAVPAAYVPPSAAAPIVTPASTNVAGRRAGAFLIDYFIALVLNMVLGGIIGFVGALLLGSSLDRETLTTVLQLVAAIVGGLFVTSFFAIPEYLWGATLGKWALSLRVVREDGARISLRQAFGRNFALLIDLLFFGLVGLLTMNGSPLHQRLGDKWAKTAVIRVR